MIVLNDAKLAFARTPGCGDGALELLLRKYVLKDGDVATALPAFGEKAIGDAKGLSSNASPAEIKKQFPRYKVVTISRNFLDAVGSEYVLKSSLISNFTDFPNFVMSAQFGLKPDTTKGSGATLRFDHLLKDLRKLLDDNEVEHTIPDNFVFDEFDRVHVGALSYSYTQDLRDYVNDFFSQKPAKAAAAQKEPAKEEKAPEKEAAEKEEVADNIEKAIKEESEKAKKAASETFIHKFNKS
jgi:hypothetical protein